MVDVVAEGPTGQGLTAAADAADAANRRAATRTWLAWACVGITGWLVAGLVLVNWAIGAGLVEDIGFSPYHVPAYLALAALVLFVAGLIVRAVRRGRSWREAFPPGYGGLLVGTVVAVIYPIADVAWREGVGPEQGIASSIAPSRLLIPVALTLIGSGPVRAALRAHTSLGGRWAAAVATGLILGTIWFTGSFHPALTPWLEQAKVPPAGVAEVWSMTADGGHQTRLIEADDLHAASWPAWSPDQSWIAFVRWTASEGNPVDADVWVAAADGSDAHAIVGGPGWQWIPHWSPDGTRIAFTQEASGGPWMATGPTGPDVAPGPQGAAFGDPAATRTHATIWMVSADGTGSPVQVTDGSADDRAAAFSPDGTRLVLDSTRDGDTNLYVVNLDGTNAVRITDDPGEDWGASWSPDGTRIVFNSDATGKSQIYVVPATGGTPTQLSHEPGWAREPTWSPDGTRIAYEAIAEDNSTSSIVSIAADGGDRRDLSNTATTSESLGGSSDAWGRDGRIVYERDEALPATAQPIVREDLAVAAMLLTTAILSLLVVVLARTGPPFGAYTITLGLGVLVVALAGGNGRFVFAALLAGLLVDVLVRFTPQRLVASVVGAVSGAAFVVLAIVAVVATTGLGWSPALVLGVPIAAGLIGWGIAAVASGGPSPTEAAAPA